MAGTAPRGTILLGVKCYIMREDEGHPSVRLFQNREESHTRGCLFSENREIERGCTRREKERKEE